MPPKQKQPSRRKVRDADEDFLDQLVMAIEGENRRKEGMTKQQAKIKNEKQVVDVMGRLQGNGELLDEFRLQRALLEQQMLNEKAVREAQYVNCPIPLKESYTKWQEVAPKKYVRYEQFDGTDEAMNFIVQLFTAELTEPYSSFTYQYFVFGWPDLTLTAYGVESDSKPDDSVVGKKVGAVVSRVTREGPGMPLRGYVAMFAVIPEFRGFRLGSRMVALTVELMREKDCDEVFLETPTTNERALSLYLNLGFTKTKFLPRYYLDHSDAVRLKLWLKDAIPTTKDVADAPTEAIEVAS